jgi:hypothetical protein
LRNGVFIKAKGMEIVRDDSVNKNSTNLMLPSIHP